jgi:hypothetical protein
MRVYTCTEWSESAQQCVVAAWIEQPKFIDYLPNMEDAQSVGFHMFASLAILAAMALLLPPRSITDD